jgi:hypothetical protein
VFKLRDFPRYENIYTKTEFPAERVEIHHGEHWLVLDWRESMRDVSDYTSPIAE